MGLFAVSRFHEPWEPADAEIMSNYGTPAAQLMLEPGQVVNEEDCVLYRIDQKKFSSSFNTKIYDERSGELIGEYKRKILSLHDRFFIDLAEGTSMELYSVKKGFEVNPHGWSIQTEGAMRNFLLFDENDSILAVISRKPMSWSGKFSIDVYAPETEAQIVMIASVLRSVFEVRSADPGV